MPIPGAFDDLVNRSELRLPAEDGLGFLRTGVKFGRISGAAAFLDHLEINPGDFFGGFNDFADGSALSVAEIELVRSIIFIQII